MWAGVQNANRELEPPAFEFRSSTGIVRRIPPVLQACHRQGHSTHGRGCGYVGKASVHLGPQGDFHRCIQWQLADPDGDAGMLADLAEHLSQQVRGSVQHLGLVCVAFGRLHVTFQTDDATDAVEVANHPLDGSEGVDHTDPGSILAVLFMQVATELALKHQFLADERQLSATHDQIAGLHGWHVTGDRCRRRGQGMSQIMKSLLDAAHGRTFRLDFAHRELPAETSGMAIRADFSNSGKHSDMRYRRLGRTGVQVSELCLGTMMFGGPTSEADSIGIMHQAIDRGINFFDTADMYSTGKSEEVVGKALQGRRDNIVLATKACNPMGPDLNQQGLSRRWLMRALDDSLRRLQTDYIDLYYVHKPDPSVPWEETLRTLDDMVRSGKVRYTAISNHRAWMVSEALGLSERQGWERFSCVQPLYNIVNRDIEVELLPLCAKQQLGVVTYSPLARGILTGKYRAGQPFPEGSRASRNDKRMQEAELRDASFEIAQQLTAYCDRKGCPTSAFSLAWCLASPVLTAVILGPRTREQFEDNLRCLDVTITSEDEAFVDQLVPPGEHSGKGFQDPAYPVTGRGTK